jgi:hypothetical protein
MIQPLLDKGSQPSKGTWMQYTRMIAAGARFNGTYIVARAQVNLL